MAEDTSWKDERRRQLRAARKELGAEARSAADAAIAQQVVTLPEYEKAATIFPYLSFGDEVDTRQIIRDAWSRGKTVALPRCVPGTRLMRWYAVDSFEGLVKSSFGVDEPAEDPQREVDPTQVDNALVLVPGLEFDMLGYRLGYGGGFYDVFLSSFNGISVGLCRDQFLQASPIRHDEHDLPANVVVSPSKVVRVS